MPLFPKSKQKYTVNSEQNIVRSRSTSSILRDYSQYVASANTVLQSQQTTVKENKTTIQDQHVQTDVEGVQLEHLWSCEKRFEKEVSDTRDQCQLQQVEIDRLEKCLIEMEGLQNENDVLRKERMNIQQRLHFVVHKDAYIDMNNCQGIQVNQIEDGIGADIGKDILCDIQAVDQKCSELQRHLQTTQDIARTIDTKVSAWELPPDTTQLQTIQTLLEQLTTSATIYPNSCTCLSSSEHSVNSEHQQTAVDETRQKTYDGTDATSLQSDCMPLVPSCSYRIDTKAPPGENGKNEEHVPSIESDIQRPSSCPNQKPEREYKTYTRNALSDTCTYEQMSSKVSMMKDTVVGINNCLKDLASEKYIS